jgi:hypothetical protein
MMCFDALTNRTFEVDFGSLGGDDLPQFVRILKEARGGWLWVEPLDENGKGLGRTVWYGPSAIFALNPHDFGDDEGEVA